MSLASDIRSTITEDSYLASMFSLYTSPALNVKGKRVLDFGCGYGWGSRELAAAGADYVWGYDTDPQRIRLAGRWFAGRNLTFSADWSVVQKQPFDVVTMFFVLQDKTALDPILRQLESLSCARICLYVAVKGSYVKKAKELFSLMRTRWSGFTVSEDEKIPLGEFEQIRKYTVILKRNKNCPPKQSFQNQ